MCKVKNEFSMKAIHGANIYWRLSKLICGNIDKRSVYKVTFFIF